jgi:hypothetical protein
MARSANRWTFPISLLILVALLVSFAVGWWLDHQAQSAELSSVRSKLENLSSLPSQPSDEELLSQNDDLIHFIDEAYTLLYEKGFHIQLDVETHQDGRLRLRADSVILKDELAAKLREIDETPDEAKPVN